MALKIVVVGVTEDEESTNWDQLWSIGNLGHNAISFNYREAASQYGLEKAGELYRDLIWEEKPDIVLFSKFNGWPSETIEWTKEMGAITWYWYMDPIAYLDKRLLKHAMVADYASATGVAQVDYMKAYGVNAYHIHEGVNYRKLRTKHSETNFGEKRKIDIAFVGSATEDRFYILKLIKEAGYNVWVGGPGWGTVDYVDYKKFVSLCANSELVLGRDRERHTYGYFSDRAFRVMAASGVYISLKPPGCEEWLRDSENCLLADTDEELVELIDSVLTNPQDYDLEKIRDNALYYSCNLSWDYRILDVLNIIKKDGRVPKEKFERRIRVLELEDEEFLRSEFRRVETIIK